MSATTEADPTPAPVPAEGGKGGRRGDKIGRLGRIRRFYREVVAELRKVIWPSRSELLSYTAIVLVFVTVIILIVAGFDYVFVKAAGALFG